MDIVLKGFLYFTTINLLWLLFMMRMKKEKQEWIITFGLLNMTISIMFGSFYLE